MPRKPPGSSPRTGRGARRKTREESQEVSVAIQALSDGQMDNIVTEDDSGHGNRLIVSTDPDFGDGPGLYFRIGEQWFKVSGLPMTTAKPALGLISVIGTRQEITVEVAITVAVGVIVFAPQLQEAFEGGTIAVAILVSGSLNLSGIPQAVETPDTQPERGLIRFIPGQPSVQILTDSQEPITYSWRLRGQLQTGFTFDQPPGVPGESPFAVHMEIAFNGQPANFGVFHPEIKNGVFQACATPQSWVFFYGQCLGVPLSNPNNPVESQVKNCVSCQANYTGPISLDSEFSNAATQIKLLGWVREVCTQAQVGLYGFVPGVLSVGTAQNFDSQAFANYQASNDSKQAVVNAGQLILFGAVPAECDNLTDEDRFINVLRGRCYEANRMARNSGRPNLPTFANVRPYFHNSGSCAGVGHSARDFLSKRYFLRILNECKNINLGLVTDGPTGAKTKLRLDGMVIWSGPGGEWGGPSGARLQGFWLALQDFYNFTGG